MDIFEQFYTAINEQKAPIMAKYMKNNFPFLGIQKPDRATLSKEFFKERKKDDQIDWDFVFKCYEMPEREFQYLAIDYISLVKKLLKPVDIENIKRLIITKSWWDSVDTINSIVGYMCFTYPNLKEDVIAKWINEDNIWLKRVTIIFQLKYKDKTDSDFLSKAILINCNTEEFFINKAIGWALREYSKTNPEWVRTFIKANNLSALSIREASKYL